ncbi:heavy-metal-associated domain-containing protein [Lampropedia puyangensis]|uniref:Heavy-metal-associated domain-containing protein n=1 Tax=Lampropedia puyangensis TaxID=1330072 RepID=A0A4S8FAD2_9BURK|nr:heavy-metal-associated domain-containing protein [Lampropedia puyangensis]THU04460.1 heavy-metal-associated domain-containing protein [Lampropedia puyangensis]
MNQTFKVTGMTCGHCVNAVQRAILKTDNTAKIQVDLPTGLVSVASSLPRSTLVAVIEEAGYKVTSP